MNKINEYYERVSLKMDRTSFKRRCEVNKIK